MIYLLLSLLFPLASAAPAPQVTRGPTLPGSGPVISSPAVTVFPSLIVPIRQQSPNTPFGTRYTVDISFTPGQSNRVDTLVSYFIPVSQDNIRSCNFKFSLPPSERNAPDNFSWSTSGTRAFEIVPLSGKRIDVGSTTYNNCPTYGTTAGTVYLADPNGGDGQVDGVFSCKSGVNEFALRKLGSGAVGFHWFELQNPLTGLVVVVNGGSAP